MMPDLPDLPQASADAAAGRWTALCGPGLVTLVTAASACLFADKLAAVANLTGSSLAVLTAMFLPVAFYLKLLPQAKAPKLPAGLDTPVKPVMTDFGTFVDDSSPELQDPVELLSLAASRTMGSGPQTATSFGLPPEQCETCSISVSAAVAVLLVSIIGGFAGVSGTYFAVTDLASR
mmetsp:Transcript_46751/g.144436  ORF Transcript_46751/g.144436 Transcript_46751/m.144436 type:complete len:177 (-) Transcript_46751:232-762(-)